MGGTPHIRIGFDTAHYSEFGGDTAHNTTYYSESGGTPHKKMCSDVHTLGWGQRTEFIDRGRDTAHNQSTGCPAESVT